MSHGKALGALTVASCVSAAAIYVYWTRVRQEELLALADEACRDAERKLQNIMRAVEV